MSTLRNGWICVLGFLLVSGFAQQHGPAGKPGPSADALPGGADHLMTLDVVVAGKSEKPVRGLQQQDFTLLDDKQSQKILSFRAVEGTTATPALPVKIILLLDEVNTSVTNVAYERDAVQNFLQRNGGRLDRPVTTAFFSDSGITYGITDSQDGDAIIADLNQRKSSLRTITRAEGFYGANDRIELSLRMLGQFAENEAATPGRKLVVWISPGWALLTGPNVDLTSKQRQSFFNTIVALSDVLRRARITLYDVDPLGTSDADELRTTAYESYVKGVKKPGQVQIGNLALQVLAVQSGGRVLNSSNDVAGEIAACDADANAFYVLTFDSLPGDGPNDYHALEIKIDKPGLKARTRAGYYAQPDHRQQ